ncbi:MAG: ribonuclease HI [Clostridia bacterium]|nr:ribonuclease HI [Clostridia bacterium]
MKTVYLYTDGACSGNPGPGGYGAILKYGKHEKEICGGDENTTNNRMELLGVIKGLEALNEPCHVVLTSDSKYVIDALSLGWAEKWKQNGWMRNKKDAALNPDLWERLLQLTSIHEMEYNWVKGHAGHPENERCDQLAVEYYQKFIK